MGYYNPIHRVCCSLHFLQRAEARKISLSPDCLSRLEKTLERMRPAYELPGQSRYRITVLREKQVLLVVYDIALKTLVTVWKIIDLSERKEDKND